jgi:hypothetical protein
LASLALKEMVFQAIKRHMKRWLYSWMRTLSKEYDTSSKKLLVEWLELDTVVEATTPHIAKKMIDWLVMKIFPFIDRTVMHRSFYLRT